MRGVPRLRAGGTVRAEVARGCVGGTLIEETAARCRRGSRWMWLVRSSCRRPHRQFATADAPRFRAGCSSWENVGIGYPPTG